MIMLQCTMEHSVTAHGERPMNLGGTLEGE
jgi:hypothetical protein